ncbi:MAG TPA: hypothetical protein VGO91_18440 [Pyrinomonadaceae bacterium]|nr:hypothetical protein [Pyrinomonadaceae bacterium]
MSNSKSGTGTKSLNAPPPLERDEQGEINVGSLANVLQWFLDYDQRVAAIRHPRVEEIFQWKQEESRRESESVYLFNKAEDRLAVGIMQALAEHDTEAGLHQWIGQLLAALEDAAKTHGEISADYGLDMEGTSAVREASKIPTANGRAIFLTTCWLDTLCTAEVRVLGWVYQELYGRPFHPNNF